ncbi:MAG: YiiX/YebB-like N1pC/P60 family cysteine hydrolase [Marinifilaceae bacterium]
MAHSIWNRINLGKSTGSLLLIFCLFACNNLQKKSDFELQKGDLLFQDLDDSSLSDAIEKVTQTGESNLSFSHVGMFVVDEKGEPLVLEAVSAGVCLTPLDTFLVRSLTLDGKPKVVVGRMKKRFRPRIQPAIEVGKKLLGKPYDSIYVMQDSAFYCSELIYEMFRGEGNDSEIFQLNPMTFKDPETGNFFPGWVEHYRKLGVLIPEGEPGLNPNGMSESQNIDLIHNFTKGSRSLNK